jgi:hypothetical protein
MLKIRGDSKERNSRLRKLRTVFRKMNLEETREGNPPVWLKDRKDILFLQAPGQKK